jgi:hypothetical protein
MRTLIERFENKVTFVLHAEEMYAATSLVVIDDFFNILYMLTSLLLIFKLAMDECQRVRCLTGGC